MRASVARLPLFQVMEWLEMRLSDESVAIIMNVIKRVCKDLKITLSLDDCTCGWSKMTSASIVLPRCFFSFVVYFGFHYSLNVMNIFSAPLVSLYFTFFWFIRDMFYQYRWNMCDQHHGSHRAPGLCLSLSMLRKFPGCPLSSFPLILYVQQSVYSTWTQTSNSLRYSGWGGCVCHFRDSSSSFFFSMYPSV